MNHDEIEPGLDEGPVGTSSRDYTNQGRHDASLENGGTAGQESWFPNGELDGSFEDDDGEDEDEDEYRDNNRPGFLSSNIYGLESVPEEGGSVASTPTKGALSPSGSDLLGADSDLEERSLERDDRFGGQGRHYGNAPAASAGGSQPAAASAVIGAGGRSSSDARRDDTTTAKATTSTNILEDGPKERLSLRQSDTGIPPMSLKSMGDDGDFDKSAPWALAPKDIIKEKRDVHQFQSLADISSVASSESGISSLHNRDSPNKNKSLDNKPDRPRNKFATVPPAAMIMEKDQDVSESETSTNVGDLQSILGDDYKMENTREPQPLPIVNAQHPNKNLGPTSNANLVEKHSPTPMDSELAGYRNNTEKKSPTRSDAEVKRRARGGRRSQALANARGSLATERQSGVAASVISQVLDPNFSAAREPEYDQNIVDSQNLSSSVAVRPGAVSVDEPAPKITDRKGTKFRYGNRRQGAANARDRSPTSQSILGRETAPLPMSAPGIASTGMSQSEPNIESSSTPAPATAPVAAGPDLLSPTGFSSYDYHEEANINDGLSAFSMPASEPAAPANETLTADVMVAEVTPATDAPVSRVDITSPSSAIHSEITSSHFDPTNQFNGLAEGAISAELVPTGAQATEEERERIRRQAEKEAEERLFGNVVTAATEVVVIDPEKEENERRKRRRMIIFAFCCLVVVIVVIIVSVVLTRPDNSSSPIQFNDVCQDAFSIKDNVTGSNSVASSDNVTCQGADPDGGLGLWYFLEGEGKRVMASTCFNSEFFDEPPPFENLLNDTVLLVFSGGCNDLTCIGGSDESAISGTCASQSNVGWFAEAGVSYFILVSGYRASSTGTFALDIKTVDDNGSCRNAQTIDDSFFELFSSTRNLTVDTDSFIDCSASANTFSPGAWYRIEGDGQSYRASVYNERSAARLSLLTGNSCGELACAEKNSTSLVELSWNAEIGSTYFVVVHGENETSTFDFFLNVSVPLSENDSCGDATLATPSDAIIAGTTKNAKPDEPVDCSRQSAAPGIWYLVDGTGGALTAATCETRSGFVVNLSVFSGNSCNSLDCVDTISTPCGAQTSVTWISSVGTPYHIFAQAFVSGTGDFNLTITEGMPHSADSCASATLIDSTDGAPILGSTIGASMNGGQCSTVLSPGVWYIFTGTGADLIASLCHQGTNFPAAIDVFVGGCSRLNCVDTSLGFCANGNPSVFWSSVLGEEYHILVHGQSSTDSGTFQLSIREENLNVPNDVCETAEELSYPSSMLTSVLGATTNAGQDEVDNCGQGRQTSPGVWYRVEGIGARIVASLCSDVTDYDTQIYVYSGACDTLECVASDDDSCPAGRSEVSWLAEMGVSYSIFVTGFGEVGNFELTLEEAGQRR